MSPRSAAAKERSNRLRTVTPLRFRKQGVAGVGLTEFDDDEPVGDNLAGAREPAEATGRSPGAEKGNEREPGAEGDAAGGDGGVITASAVAPRLEQTAAPSNRESAVTEQDAAGSAAEAPPETRPNATAETTAELATVTFGTLITVAFGSLLSLPSNPPTLDEIKSYRASGERDDRLWLSVPKSIYTVLEVLAALGESRSRINNIAIWALNRGLDRVENLPEAVAIKSARHALLRAGGEGVDQLEWPYTIRGEKQLNLRCVKDSNRCSAIAQQLGLQTSTLGSVTLMASLFDAPLPESSPYPSRFERELKEFGRRLRAQAQHAQLLCERILALPAAPTTELRSWDALFKEEE
jgi:hypothetical protein